jgi:hypothetical protein
LAYRRATVQNNDTEMMNHTIFAHLSGIKASGTITAKSHGGL